MSHGLTRMHTDREKRTKNGPISDFVSHFNDYRVCIQCLIRGLDDNSLRSLRIVFRLRLVLETPVSPIVLDSAVPTHLDPLLLPCSCPCFHPRPVRGLTGA